MSTGNGTPLALQHSPTVVTHELLAIGIAFRVAFAGVFLAMLGIVALFDGGIAPVSAAVLAILGGGLAFVAIRYVLQWSRAESTAAPALERPAATARSSMHQPVLSTQDR